MYMISKTYMARRTKMTAKMNIQMICAAVDENYLMACEESL